ncbi:MAG: glycoside hydrolase family 32 protein [Pseudomonadota bacterium]
MTKLQNAIVKDADPASREREPWRPHVHFTPRKNWINDPNGLVYFEGEYHLFYQYNPHGKDWGHMSWGHAVSPDLIHWTHLPVAIPEQDYMVFSGCALVDWDNTSGLGDGKKPPLLAYFTAHHHRGEERQTQCLAYSHDRGRTWQMYAGNPLIDLDLDHFRDPSVFWHGPSRAWIMVVALPRAHQVQIYRSVNLTNWSLASSFGPAGATGGQWECPALMEVPDEAGSGAMRWVLKVDVDLDLVGEGSGAQYFVGDFDGHIFTADELGGEPIAQIADFGSDFYAAIPWSDLPEAHTHPVWIGWMSNHQTGRYYPTDPWRGAMTIPRELFVFQEAGQWRLGQRPVGFGRAEKELLARKASFSVEPGEALYVMTLSEGAAANLQFNIDTTEGGVAELQLADESGGALNIIWDTTTRQIAIDRGHGWFHASPVVHARRADPIESAGGQVRFQVLVDASSIEIFVNGGRRVLTQSIFPKGDLAISFAASTQTVRVQDFEAKRLSVP